METHVLVGAVLIMAGLGELPIGFLISSRVPEQKRMPLLIALGASGMLMLVLGMAFMLKLIPLGG